MVRTLPVDAFLAAAAQQPVIDVRSPGEFHHGHIPGAINIPIFDDDERARVGTCYKRQGHDAAVLLGLDIVGPKLGGFVRAVDALQARDRAVLVHCWRGGMRSGSFAQLLDAAGYTVHTLQKGYKNYRRHVLASFAQPLKLIIVGGETGSGKTEIISALRDAGEQVVDLEDLAVHKGSSFGALGLPKQPMPEHFENKLHHALQQLDHTRRIWLEDESRSIGRVMVPAGLWDQMVAAPVLRVRVPREIRLQRLVRDYGNFTKEDIRSAVERIRKRIGGLALKQALEAIETGNAEEVARITLDYYDRAYDHPHAEKKYAGVQFVDCPENDPALHAQRLIALADQQQ